MGDPLFAKYGKSMKAGDLLFEQGEIGHEMFVVRSGFVKISLKSQGSIEKTLAILGPGEFVGEMSILNDQPRSATATIYQDAELLVVGVRVLEEMIVHNTEIALRLIRKLGKRLESADSLIRVLLHTDPNERVIENLKRLAKMHNAKDGKPAVIQASFEAMAEQVGVEQSIVEDIMLKLIGAGFIQLDGSNWLISKTEDIDDFVNFLKMKAKYN